MCLFINQGIDVEKQTNKKAKRGGGATKIIY